VSAAFLDSNILLYTLAEGDPREAVAAALLARGGVISVQVLNEFAAVARRKLRLSWPEVVEALAALRALCPAPRPLTLATHEAALGLADRYGFQIYDALIVAAALEAGCATLFSEDLQDGQVIEGRLTIRNPFAAA
jgi:predicted nucleic acid-binding protein